jgi:hypothetical protein
MVTSLGGALTLVKLILTALTFPLSLVTESGASTINGYILLAPLDTNVPPVPGVIVMMSEELTEAIAGTIVNVITSPAEAVAPGIARAN